MTHSEQRDWHVLWGEGDLTLRLRTGAQIGEDAAGEIRFLPSSEGCWIEFTIDDEHNLWVSPVGGSHQLTLGENDLANRVMLEPGTQIKLPNNSLHISTSMQRCASSDVSVTLSELVPRSVRMLRAKSVFSRLPKVAGSNSPSTMSITFGLARSAAHINSPLAKTISPIE